MEPTKKKNLKKVAKPAKLSYRTEWNLGLLYSSHDDPSIEADTKALEAAYEAFAKKYSPRQDYLTSEAALFEALTEWEKLSEQADSYRPGLYYSYSKYLNSEDAVADAKLNLLISRLTKAGNTILFFCLRLAKIEAAKQKEFLASKKLAHFQYFLKQIFETARYNLSEAEEKIMSLKSLPAHSLWTDGQEKLLNIQTVRFQGKEMPMAEALNKVASLPVGPRRTLWYAITAKLKEISYFAEAEVNAVYTDKKINDELRGFATPYAATVLGYQNDAQTVENLVKTVTTHFPVAHRFYALKAKLLKLKTLEYADRGADLGKISRKVPFSESVDILMSAFSKVDAKYPKILREYLQNGQIDAFPKKGKEGGAFCSSSVNNPTFVLLNHSDTLDSVMTFGHEMGHAFHGELSDVQPVLYKGYSYSVAETASTLFENFVFEEIFEKLSDKEKIFALHDRINDAMSTIFRQIACFNFELALHTAIREKGALTRQEIAALLNTHMGAYLGPAVKLLENDGYFFVTWGHIRRFFYVYSYAYGFLISRALYQHYKQNKSYLKKIEQFLSAGGSKSPEDIFKDIGIDVTRPEFFADGIRAIEEDIVHLEKLAKGAGMIK